MATTLRKPRQTAPATDNDSDAGGDNWGASAPPPVLYATPGDDEIEQSETDRVLELIQSSNGAGIDFVQVNKIIDGKSTYCARYSPSEFEEGGFDLLREAFGAGRFKLMLYGTKPETGQYGIRTRSEISIAENRSAKPAQGTAPADTGMTQVLASIAEGQRQMLDALISIKQAPPVDQMGEMTKMLSLMTMMREAMGMNQPQQQKSNIGEIVAAVRELRGVASEIMPERANDDDSNGMMAMLPKVLDIIQTSVANNAQQPRQTAPTALPVVTLPSGIANAPAAAPAPVQTTTEHDAMKLSELSTLKARLNQLFEMAAENAPIADGAELIYDHLPDELIDVLAEPNWLELLRVIDPRSTDTTLTAWLTQARDMALGMFEPETAPDAVGGDHAPVLTS